MLLLLPLCGVKGRTRKWEGSKLKLKPLALEAVRSCPHLLSEEAAVKLGGSIPLLRLDSEGMAWIEEEVTDQYANQVSKFVGLYQAKQKKNNSTQCVKSRGEQHELN